jgi:hypothetical protein
MPSFGRKACSYVAASGERCNYGWPAGAGCVLRWAPGLGTWLGVVTAWDRIARWEDTTLLVLQSDTERWQRDAAPIAPAKARQGVNKTVRL